MRWVVSVKGVLVVEGSVLLGLNDRGEWELPGGQLEEGEQPRQTVVRELAEETSLVVDAGRILLADTFDVVPGRTVLVVAYECTAVGSLDVRASAEHEALRWTPLGELDAIALPGIYRRAVAAALVDDAEALRDAR
ncbi:NUDIX domain-containing protein [Isoptericola sp. F-RaC21]|uniref:NUDIX domain-containing protein n=1 Tax=Isoptericola sp. F-RaC21 TaxID=3141452 RepID=UPI00315B61DA